LIIGGKDLEYYTGRDLKYAVVCDSEDQAAALKEALPNPKVIFTQNEDLALKINELYHEEMKIRRSELVENLFQSAEFYQVPRANFTKYFELVYDKNSYIKSVYARFDRVIKDLFKYKEVVCLPS